MKKTKRYALIIALAMIISGAAIFFIAFAISGFNFSKLSAEKIITQNTEINEQFRRISVSSNEYDLKILRSDTEQCRVVYTGSEKQLLLCSVKDSELVIDLKNTRKWYEVIDLTFPIDMGQSNTGLWVYLPDKEYEAFFASSYSGSIDIDSGFKFSEANIDTMSGNIKAGGITADKLDIQSYSGKIDISDISASDIINIATTSGAIHSENVDANNASVNSYSGKITLENFIAKKSFSIETQSGNAVINGSADSIIVDSYSGKVSFDNFIAEKLLSVETMSGNVVFNGCDAGEIAVDTYSGSVSGTLLSDKIFVTSTYSGSINVPVSSGSEICTINTQSGNIMISIRSPLKTQVLR